MRAVVAGGAGFIGSHLCKALLEQGFQVICLDNLLTGSRRNLTGILAHPAFRFLDYDLTSTAPLPLEGPLEVIYHLASPASVVDYTRHALPTLLVNSQGTHTLLKLAQQSGARFLFTSTSEIYGNPLEHPQSETYFGNVNPNGPRSMYDESKRFAEALTMHYVRENGVNGRIVRIFNTYGPHSRPDDGRVVPNFVTQALRGLPLTVYGDGEQTRSFCYVADLVRGLLAAMDTPQTCGEVFNLGNPEEYTIAQFAEIILGLCGSRAGIMRAPLPAEDPERRCPDIAKAQRMLQWTPTTDLRTGLQATMEWFRSLNIENVA